MNKSDMLLLERCHKGPVSFKYEPNARGALKLVESSISESQKKHLHRLALDGQLAEHTEGDGTAETPYMAISFAITAKGRESAGIRCPVGPPVHWHRLASDEELEREGLA